MATSTCPKCNSTKFELKEADVKDSYYKINFIQCSSCGCVVGTHEYYNVGQLIHNLAKKLNIKL